jgi:hypothetical protein
MLKLKKPLFAVLLTAASAVAMAQSGAPQPGTPGDGANFAAYKQKELAQIAAHIQVAQTLQACVQGAADREALKVCREAAHASMGHKRG